jgi:hypothetical protein
VSQVRVGERKVSGSRRKIERRLSVANEGMNMSKGRVKEREQE